MTGSRPPSPLARALLWVLAGLAPLALAAGTDGDPSWASLTPAQQYFLAPLKPEWAGIDKPRKQKWLEVAARFPVMPADERQRVQQRMSEWARMSPGQRAQARLRFQEAQQIPPQERQAKWEAYQALSPDERKSLSQRAKPVTAPPPAPAVAGGTAKRNVATVATGVKVRPVLPTVVQAKPGATTTSMTTPAAPPPHHQAGMPKIAATPGFVDRTTLLPKRGPQGAAVRTAASSDPTTQP